MTKVEIDGRTYCVETLIYAVKRLTKDVKASAECHRLILEQIRNEIEQIADEEQKHDEKWATGLRYAVKIIDKYKGVIDV